MTWDEAAEGYAAVQDLTTDYCEEAAAVAVSAIQESTSVPSVLDIACGTGTALRCMAEHLAARGHTQATLVGTDYSASMVARTEAAMAGGAAPSSFVVTVHQDDATWLKAVPTGSVDAATMVFGIMYVPDAAEALRSVARVLRPGGAAVVVTWHWVRAMELMEAVRADQGKPPFPTEGGTMVQFGDQGALRRLIDTSGCGLHIERMAFPQHERLMEVGTLTALCEASPLFVPLRPWDHDATRATLERFAEPCGRIRTSGTAIMTTLRKV